MLEKLSKYIPDLKVSAIMGGSSIKKQERELAERPDILISTTGRLIDLLSNSKNITLDSVEILILDEADKLLELGFKTHIEEILKYLKGSVK